MRRYDNEAHFIFSPLALKPSERSERMACVAIQSKQPPTDDHHDLSLLGILKHSHFIDPFFKELSRNATMILTFEYILRYAIAPEVELPREQYQFSVST
jgi:hypothetical protein